MTAPHIAVIGNVNVDIIMGPQPPWPRPGTEVVLPDFELRVGGQAGNAALALQALGTPFRLLANAGDDTLGAWLKQSFGAAAAHWRLAAAPTTVSVGITHPNGERTFFTNRGHLEAFGLEDVLPFLPERAPDGSMALLVGTFLTPLLAAAMPDLVRALTAANYRIALDTGWPPQGWSNAVHAEIRSWLASVDLLLVNEVEAFAIGQASDLGQAAANIRALLPAHATLIVKRGADGADGYHDGALEHADSPAVAVADSIGAGDIFNAGFLTAVMNGSPLREALAAGIALASATIATRPRRFPTRAAAP